MNPILLIVIASKVRIIADYFKSKKAISPDSAINPEAEWLKKNGYTTKHLDKISYIKSAADGKYWLDQKEFDKELRITLLVYLVAILAFFLFIAGVIIFIEFSN